MVTVVVEVLLFSKGRSEKASQMERPDEGKKLAPKIFRGREFQGEATQIPIEAVR